MAVLLPLLGAPLLALFGQPGQGAWANLLLTVLEFVLTGWVGLAPGQGLVHADGLGVIFGLLSGFVGVTTAIGNVAFVRARITAFSLRGWRLYHGLFQAVLGLTLLGLYADDIGLLWLAVEGSTVAAALGLGLWRGAAAWQCLVLGGVSLMLALFGTLLTYLAAQAVLGPGLSALGFAALGQNAARLHGPLMTLAFLFLLLGYGGQAILVSLQSKRDAPPLAMLPLNVALLAILRFSHLAAAPAPMLALGLASVLLAGLLMTRRRAIGRLSGVASLANAGLAVFAFGIGGAAAIFGGLLLMILHTLSQSGLLQALSLPAPRGGILRWLRGGSVFALTGLPPSGLFVAQYLILSQTLLRAPWLAAPLLLGLLLCNVALLRAAGRLLPAPATEAGGAWGQITVALHLLLALVIAFAMPAALVAALSVAAAGLR